MTDKNKETTGGAAQAPSVNPRLQALATGKIGRLLWNYSLPAVTGMLVMSLYNVVDRIFIGQGAGPEAIAGLAITFPVMNIATALGVLIGAGASDVYKRQCRYFSAPTIMKERRGCLAMRSPLPSSSERSI